MLVAAVLLLLTQITELDIGLSKSNQMCVLVCHSAHRNEVHSRVFFSVHLLHCFMLPNTLVWTHGPLHSFLTPLLMTLLCVLYSTILMSLLKIPFKGYNRVTGIVGRFCNTNRLIYFHSAAFEVCFALIINHETHPGHGHLVSMFISMEAYTRLTYIILYHVVLYPGVKAFMITSKLA